MNPRVRCFGVFELDGAMGELRKRGVRVRLQEQPRLILEALLERPGELVGRENLKEKLWPNDPVYRTDDNLNRAVKRLREALGEGAENPRYVETVPQRGYRFLEPVRESEPIRLTVDHRTASAFVGREQELRFFHDVIEKARNGRGNVVFIGGEPGVGKTRLAEKVLQEASRVGAHAAFGRCYEREGTPPFTPISEIVERGARYLDPERLRNLLGERAPEVARLVPEMGRWLSDIPPLPALPPEMQRRNLFNGFLEFLRRWSSEAPLVFLLDDLHAADASTLALVDHLADHVPAMPLLMVVTYRDTEVASRPRFAETLEEIVRKRLGEYLGLERLRKTEVGDVLRGRTGATPPEDLVDRLFRFTDGNPFYVEEVLQSIGNHWNDRAWTIPENVRLVTSRRLKRLSDESKAVLNAAAVIGRDFSVELLGALGLEKLDEALEEVLLARLVRFDRDSSYVFEHEILRRALLDEMPLPRRRRLHLAVANALGFLRPKSHAERAYHFRSAGHLAPPVRVAESLVAAAEEAISAAAADDALRHADAALELESSMDVSWRARLRDVRGMALWALERWNDAMADWDRALGFFESLGDVEGVSRVSRLMTIPLLWTGRFDEVATLVARAERSIGEEPTEPRCLLLCSRAIEKCMGRASGAAEAIPAMEEAERIARSVGSQEIEGIVLMYAAIVWFYREEHRRTAEVGMRSASLLRGAGNLVDLAMSLAVVQAARLSLGEVHAVEALAEEVEPVCERIGHRGARLWTERTRAWRTAMTTGELEPLESHVLNHELGPVMGGFLQNMAHTNLGLIRFWKGHWSAAREAMERALSLEKNDFSSGTALGGRILIGAYRGEREVLQLYREHASRLPWAGRTARTGQWRFLIRAVEALAMLEEWDEAGSLYGGANEISSRGAVTLIWSETLLQKIAGIAAAAGGQWELAEEHFERALAQADDTPYRIDQPEVRRWYAWMLRARDRADDRARASRLLKDALRGYVKIGMPRHVELARSMLPS